MIEVKAISVGTEILLTFPMLMESSIQEAIALNIMEGARAWLMKKAGEELHTSRADYIQGIQPLEVEHGGVSLLLTGALPNMVEHGWEAQFLHEHLLAQGANITPEGTRYRAIPFVHKGLNAGGQGGQAMGSQFMPAVTKGKNADILGIAQAKLIGKKVHSRASRLVTAAEKAAGKKGRTSLQAGLSRKLKPHHVSDIFAGMKVTKQPVSKPGGGAGTQKKYTTFRTISDARPDAWHHPGIEAHHFFDEMGDHIEKIGPKAVQAFVEGLIG